jgi:hypothetical protein
MCPVHAIPASAVISFAMLAAAFVNMECFVGFEALTAVVMKSTIFWDVMPCGHGGEEEYI